MPIDVSDPDYDPADDAWAENFVFANDDGYYTLVWTSTSDEHDDDDRLVQFIEAGDKMIDVLRKMRLFDPESNQED